MVEESTSGDGNPDSGVVQVVESGLDRPSVDAAEEFVDTDAIADELFAARAAIEKCLAALGFEEESDSEDAEDYDAADAKASRHA